MLNDLEICKRIAEIEGRTYWSSGHGEGLHLHYVEGNENSRILYYNPLTDDALCFELMIKYKLSLIAPEGEQVEWDCVISDVLTTDKSPNQAICLCIIEAHKQC